MSRYKLASRYNYFRTGISHILALRPPPDSPDCVGFGSNALGSGRTVRTKDAMDALALKVACLAVVCYCAIWWFRILAKMRSRRPPLVWRSFLPFFGTARAIRVWPDKFLSSMVNAYPEGFSFISSPKQRVIHFISAPNESVLALFASVESNAEPTESCIHEAVEWYLSWELGDSGSLDLVDAFGNLSLLIDMKHTLGGTLWKDTALREQILRVLRKCSKRSREREELVLRICEALGTQNSQLKASSGSGDTKEEVERILTVLEQRKDRFVATVANCCKHILSDGSLEQVEEQIQKCKRPSDAKLLQQCIEEAARLYQPVISMVELNAAFSYGAYCFESGDTLAISPYLNARKDASLEAPEEFRLLRTNRTASRRLPQLVALGRMLQEFDLTLLRTTSRLEWRSMVPCTLFVYYQRKSYGIKSKFI